MSENVTYFITVFPGRSHKYYFNNDGNVSF